MSEHERKAEELEGELDQMQQQSGELREDIEGAREDWESKQRDESVPGAVGDPGDDEESGEDELAADDLDFGRDVEKADIVGDAPPEEDD